MKPLTVEELQQILDKTGLTKNAIEKKFGMGNGSIGKFLIGKLNSLPDKYVAKIRKLEVLVNINQKNNIQHEFSDEVLSEKFEGESKLRYVPNSPLEPIIEVVNDMKLVEENIAKIKRPLIDKNLLP